MNGGNETKSEIRARIDELERVRERMDSTLLMSGLESGLRRRLEELRMSLQEAEEDLSSNIIKSHKAICQVKQMDEKAAYGNDPAVYYTLGVCGEAGEMANAIVKAQRNGSDRQKVLEAVKSELPDVIIYSFVLAHVLDIDLAKLVNDKVGVVVQRAHDGYYGRPLESSVPGARPTDHRAFCEECGGDLGGTHVGRLERHESGCPRFPL
jgi:NTP pyrophosphatase (non-canonical NTP hydrolase)